MFVSAACEVKRPNMEPEAAVLPSEMIRSRSPEDEWIRYYLKLEDEVLSPSDPS